jgi:hypothetical protein
MPDELQKTIVHRIYRRVSDVKELPWLVRRASRGSDWHIDSAEVPNEDAACPTPFLPKEFLEFKKPHCPTAATQGIHQLIERSNYFAERSSEYVFVF